MTVSWAGNNPTVMGWNQRVLVKRDTFQNLLKVKSFSVGVTQTFEVPDLVTGASDRITWSKGTIDLRGNIEAPLTKSLFETVVQAADAACTGSNDESILYVYSDIHGGPYPCMVNTMTITAREKEAINVSGELIGRLGDADIHSNTTGTDAVITVGGRGSAAGFTVGGSVSGGGVEITSSVNAAEQIVMFDRVSLGTGMNPIDCTQLLPTGITLTIDNKLQQNYVLGCGDGQGSLDAWSISPGQRTISGTVTFMSGTAGTMGYVTNAGVTSQTSGNLLTIGDPADPLLEIDGAAFMVLWGAKPPTLGVEKVVVELTFTLIAKEAGLYSLTGLSGSGFTAVS